ncbi:NAD(P)/FAD-dependent oxidoreductase [Candidatus Peribacteria bacterium]|nr:MAG: NAD(P)/FAD-dependent oxidoreductase [Candidatus Peribacteria bacterium]
MSRPITHNRSPITHDVIVIGGGPAGMIAAGRAAELGAKVILLEKNPGTGKKLLITGGGRCNILNAEFDTHRLVDKYGKKGKSLFSVFSQFDAQATRDFFEQRGLKIKVEAEQRAFPVSEKAADVRLVLLKYMQEGNVEIRTDAEVKGIEGANGKITGIVLADGKISARHYILATGGLSHPETGSTGDGFSWLSNLGHTVITPDPALVPVTLKDTWVKKVMGISLKNVQLTILQNGQKKAAAKGKMLFTHTGLSGPLVLNMSKQIGALLKEGEVLLSLDLFPALDPGALDRKVLDVFEQGKNKLIRNNIGDIVQPRLGDILLKLAHINTDTPLYQLTKEDRTAFVTILKNVPLHVSGLLGTDKAVVTGGGVLLKEVEFKTMRSKLYDNLFLAGDILDFDRPSGGFSLQICWTTGYVAGSHAAIPLS